MTSPFIPQLPSDRPPSRWRWLIGSLVAVGALWAGFFWWSRDEAPPDARDLLLVPRQLPDDENAYLVFFATAEKLDSSPWEHDADLFDKMVVGKAWDAAKASRWLAANTSLWSGIERAADLPYGQARVQESGISPPFGLIRNLIGLAVLRALELSDQGQHEAAVNWLGTCLRAVHCIENSQPSVISLSNGYGLKGIIFRGIETLALRDRFAPDVGRKLISTLEACRPTRSGIGAAISSEHRFVRFNLAEIARVMHRGDHLSIFGKLRIAALKSALLFKPNKTLGLQADYLRRVVEVMDLNQRSLDQSYPHITDLLPQDWRRRNPDNMIGRLTLPIITSDLQSFLEKRLRLQSTVSATQALVALHLYAVENGRLPATLAELVPVYLPQVPRDYSDDTSIRYSREFRAIWSLGKENLNITTLDPAIDATDVYLKVPATIR
jgi:hypothetical protein